MPEKEFFTNPVIAKKLLNKIYLMDNEIKMLLEEVERLGELAKGVQSSRISGMPKSGSLPSEQVFFIKNVTSLIKYEDELKREMNKFYEFKNLMLGAVNCLESPLERQILLLKYFHYLSDKEVSERLNVSLSTVYRKFRSALKNFKIPIRFLDEEPPTKRTLKKNAPTQNQIKT